MTESLFNHLGVGPGWTCLEVGAGIGLVTLPLAERVGSRGRVTALEASPLYANTLREELARKNIANVLLFEGEPRRFAVDKARYDLIFARWFFSFQPEVAKSLRRLVCGLKPGGALAIEDYHHLGCAFYPNRPSFDAVIEGARAWYRRIGGNYRIAGELPALYYRLGLERVEVIPHLRVGGPKTELWRWSELFFLGQLPALIRERLISPGLARRFRRDLEQIKKVPGALFVVPAIFDVIGRAPAAGR